MLVVDLSIAVLSPYHCQLRVCIIDDMRLRADNTFIHAENIMKWRGNGHYVVWNQLLTFW